MDFSGYIKKIIDGINRLNIVPGIGNPYKQFTYVIPDGGIESLFYSFNYFRILTISATSGVTIRFGSSGTPTDVIGAGIGYKLPDTVDRAQIINNSGGALTITVAVAVGEIFDDRLNISGNISVINAVGTQLDVKTAGSNYVEIRQSATTMTSSVDVTLAAGVAGSVITSLATRREVFITNLSTTETVRLAQSGGTVSATRGMALLPQQSVVLAYSGAVTGFATNGATLAVCSLSD